MPRLMMSRPWAASACARASTAKAFSSPIRSKAAMVCSMAFLFSVSLPLPACGERKRRASGYTGIRPRWLALVRLVLEPREFHFSHTHYLENNRDRPADQQQAIERGDWAQQPLAFRRHRIAVAERSIILEGKFESGGEIGLHVGDFVERRPERDLAHMRAHQADHRNIHQCGDAHEDMQMIGARRHVAGREHDGAGDQRVDTKVEEADDAA